MIEQEKMNKMTNCLATFRPINVHTVNCYEIKNFSDTIEFIKKHNFTGNYNINKAMSKDELAKLCRWMNESRCKYNDYMVHPNDSGGITIEGHQT